MTIRFSTNFGAEFIPGPNGAFYLLQVRSILKSGFILLNDFPLVFYLQSLLVISLKLLTGFDQSESIDFAVRLFDSIIPPLSLIPAYLIVTKIIPDEKFFSKISVAAISIFSYTYFLLSSDFQKNIFGLYLVLWLIYFFIDYIYENWKRNLYLSVLFFILISITHFGTLLFASSIIIFYLALRLFYTNFRKAIRYLILLIIIPIIVFYIISIISPPRTETLLSALTSLFSEPVLITLFSFVPSYSIYELINILIINCALGYSYYLYTLQIDLPQKEKTIYLTFAGTTFLFASPLIGIEWAQRLYFMTYISAIPIIAFIIKFNSSKKRIVIGAIIIYLLLSILAYKSQPVISNMTKPQYDELTLINNQLPKGKSNVIISRMGLVYWCGYIVSPLIGTEEVVTKTWWESFDNIFYLVQKKDNPPFGEFGVYGKPYKEPATPKSAELFFKGQYFNLYLVK